MRTYSNDLRERIVRACGAGQSAAEVARLFRVCKRSVERYWQKYQSTQSVAPKRRGGYRRSQLAEHDAQLRTWLEAENDLSLRQLQARIRRDLGLKLGITALWHRLEHLNLSYKKNAARRRARPGRPPGRPPKLAPPAKRVGRPKARLPR